MSTSKVKYSLIIVVVRVTTFFFIKQLLSILYETQEWSYSRANCQHEHWCILILRELNIILIQSNKDLISNLDYIIDIATAQTSEQFFLGSEFFMLLNKKSNSFLIVIANRIFSWFINAYTLNKHNKRQSLNLIFLNKFNDIFLFYNDFLVVKLY